MCDKAISNFLTELKFVSDQFVTGNLIKELEDDLFANDDIIFFGKNFVMEHFLMMRWVFLVQILITLTLMVILKKIILKIMSDLWLCVINLNNENHVKPSSAEY